MPEVKPVEIFVSTKTRKWRKSSIFISLIF